MNQVGNMFMRTITQKLQNMWQKIAELEDEGFKRNYQLHYQCFKLNPPFSTLWLTKKDIVKYDNAKNMFKVHFT